MSDTPEVPPDLLARADCYVTDSMPEGDAADPSRWWLVRIIRDAWLAGHAAAQADRASPPFDVGDRVEWSVTSRPDWLPGDCKFHRGEVISVGRTTLAVRIYSGAVIMLSISEARRA